MPALTVKEDLVEGCRFRQDASGLHFVRRFVVSNAQAVNPLTNAPWQVIAAAALRAPGIPRYGDAYSEKNGFNNPGLVVNVIEAMPLTDLSRTDVSITVVYGPKQENAFAWNVEISGSNSIKNMERWQVDNIPDPANGVSANSPILVGYAPLSNKTFDYPINPADAAKPNQPADTNPSYYDYASIPVLSPNMVVRFSKALGGSQLRGVGFPGPLHASNIYRRKVNAAIFLGGAIGTWLCRDATAKWIGIPAQGGPTASPQPNGAAPMYMVSFLFEWQPEGWNRVEFFRSSIDGRVPTSINPASGTNNGYINFAPYKSVDFSALNLPDIA